MIDDDFELSKLNICFITGTLGQGGAEQQLFYIIKTLKDAGARVTLLSLTRGEFWEEPIRELGVPVIWVGEKPSRLSRFKKIYAELVSIKPDVFQAQHFYTNLYVSTAAFAQGIKGVGAMRNDGTSEMRDLGWLMSRLSLHTPRMIAANSALGMQNAKRWGVPESRLQLLRNVVDTDKFRPSARANNGAINILAIGRLSRQKRMDRFLRAIAQIAPRVRVPIKALIFGDGPERAELEASAYKLGLTGGVVEFKGRAADSREAYSQAHLLALTSDWEGTPNVILEAMSSGLPVVATDTGDVADIIKNGETGFLAAAHDEITLAESILRLAENDDLRMKFGCRAREHIVANYSLRLLPRQLDTFYRVVFQ